MLTKHSIATLLLLCAAAHASAQAQAPLWFDSNAAMSQSPAKTPAATASNTLGWIEANKLETQQSQATSAATSPVTSPPQTNSPSNKSKAPRAAPTLVEGKSNEKVQSAEKWAASLTPWSSLSEMSKILSQPTRDVAVGSQTADAFIKRAESQLKLMHTPAEQIVAPKQVFPKPTATVSQAFTATPAPTASVAATKVGREISTKLSSRALQCGEVENEFRWPTAGRKQLPASELVETKASEVIAASEESLIPRDATTSVFWQDADTKRGGVGAGGAGAGGVEASEVEPFEAEIESPSDAMKTRLQDQEKFRTASMVGPMTNAGQLFSMLEVQDRFQGYAEPVQSVRTRDLDSPSQSPYTWECYTYISPVFYHKPLYFEQPNLERYGQGTYRCLQPAASSIHFFGTIPLLPYKILTQHPCEKHYTLGNQRPGNCNAVQKRVILGQSYLGEVREYWRPESGY